MREIEVGVGKGAGIAPGAGMDADRPHEGAEMQLACSAHGSIFWLEEGPEADRMAASRPGNRASISARRATLTTSAPRRSDRTRPASRRIWKWRDRLDFGMGAGAHLMQLTGAASARYNVRNR